MIIKYKILLQTPKKYYSSGYFYIEEKKTTYTWRKVCEILTKWIQKKKNKDKLQPSPDFVAIYCMMMVRVL